MRSSYKPIAGDEALLRSGVTRLAVERLGLLVPGTEFQITHDLTWRQCNQAGGQCAYYYAGRGGYVRDCDVIISSHGLRLDVGPDTEVRGWAYAYSLAEKYGQVDNPSNSLALGGWCEFDIWIHQANADHVTRLARRIAADGRVTMARRSGFDGMVPEIVGFSRVGNSTHHITYTARKDPAW